MQYENEIELFDKIEDYRTTLRSIYGVNISINEAINILKVFQLNKISFYLEQIEPELNNIHERISELPDNETVKDKLGQICEALSEIALQ